MRPEEGRRPGIRRPVGPDGAGRGPTRALIPAFAFSRSTSRTPDHSAFPTAPRSQPTPGIVGAEVCPAVPRALQDRRQGGTSARAPSGRRAPGLRGCSTSPSTARPPGGQPDRRGPEVAPDEEQAVGGEEAIKHLDGGLGIKGPGRADDQIGLIHGGNQRRGQAGGHPDERRAGQGHLEEIAAAGLAHDPGPFFEYGSRSTGPVYPDRGGSDREGGVEAWDRLIAAASCGMIQA